MDGTAVATLVPEQQLSPKYFQIFPPSIKWFLALAP